MKTKTITVLWGAARVRVEMLEVRPGTWEGSFGKVELRDEQKTYGGPIYRAYLPIPIDLIPNTEFAGSTVLCSDTGKAFGVARSNLQETVDDLHHLVCAFQRFLENAANQVERG